MRPFRRVVAAIISARNDLRGSIGELRYPLHPPLWCSVEHEVADDLCVAWLFGCHGSWILGCLVLLLVSR